MLEALMTLETCRRLNKTDTRNWLLLAQFWQVCMAFPIIGLFPIFDLRFRHILYRSSLRHLVNQLQVCVVNEAKKYLFVGCTNVYMHVPIIPKTRCTHKLQWPPSLLLYIQNRAVCELFKLPSVMRINSDHFYVCLSLTSSLRHMYINLKKLRLALIVLLILLSPWFSQFHSYTTSQLPCHLYIQKETTWLQKSQQNSIIDILQHDAHIRHFLHNAAAKSTDDARSASLNHRGRSLGGIQRRAANLRARPLLPATNGPPSKTVVL